MPANSSKLCPRWPGSRDQRQTNSSDTLIGRYFGGSLHQEAMRTQLEQIQVDLAGPNPTPDGSAPGGTGGRLLAGLQLF